MVSNSAPKKRVASTVTLRDVSPEYAALWDKKQELCKRREEVQREVLALREPLSRAGEFSSLAIACNTAPNALGAPQVSKPSPEVALLLGDLMPPPAAPQAPLQLSRHRHPDMARFVALGAELASLDEAIALICCIPPHSGQRYSVFERAYLEASRKVCDLVRPEYDKIAETFCTALVALGEASLAHEDFVKERLRGVAWESLKPIRISALLGDARDDPVSEIRLLLELAATHGHFNLDDLPENWKRAKTNGGASSINQKGPAK